MKNKGFIESQKNNKTVKKKEKWTKVHTVVFIMIIFFSVGSILGIYGGISSCKTAKADSVSTVTTYNASNIVVPCSLYINSGDSLQDMNEYFYLTYDNIWVNTGTTFSMTPTFFGDFQGNYFPLDNFTISNLTTSNDVPSLPNNITTTDYKNTLTFNYVPNIDYGSISFDLIGGSFQGAMFTFKSRVTLSDIRFSGNIYMIHIWGDILSGTNYFTQKITYTDINGYTMTFTFFANSIGSRLGATGLRLAFDDRTYFIDDTLNDNEVYQAGYDDGFNKGKQNGYQSGYNDGESAGYDSGYYDGKIDGIEQANEYSFLSLFTSVIDAPLTVIGKTLDFNLLGFNMRTFFFALMSCALVLSVIRMIF